MNEISPKEVSALHGRITRELSKVIVGQEQIVRLLLACLFARGHCLLIGVPGLAKTLIVRTLSEILQLSFKRIQFTPDLMPGDIIGSEILQERERRLEHEYQPGPIFANLVLAEGTYPLPEAQLDRFMFSLYLNYPAKSEEMEVVKRTTLRELPALTPTISAEELLQVQRLVLAAPVSDHVVDYAVSLAAATRPGNADSPQVARDFVEWGAGPRASQYLILGAKALALLNGKISPETSDVREVAMPVLQHRVITNYRATGAGKKSRDVVQGILTEVREKSY